MIDIETLSTKPNAVITEIGVVISEHGHPDVCVLLQLNWSDQYAMGREIDADTLIWWLKEEDRAAKLMDAADNQHKRPHTIMVLGKLAGYLTMADEVWANSPSFDVACINSLLLMHGFPKISHKVERDFRTARALRPELEYEYPVNAHDALADAQAQADYLRELGIWPDARTEVANG
jgi:hypothetical protein